MSAIKEKRFHDGRCVVMFINTSVFSEWLSFQRAVPPSGHTGVTVTHICSSVIGVCVFMKIRRAAQSSYWWPHEYLAFRDVFSSKRFRVNVLPSVKAQLRCFLRRFGAQTRCRLLAFVQWPLTSRVSCMTQIWLFGFDPVCFCQLLNGCRENSATVWETSKYDDFMLKCGD